MPVTRRARRSPRRRARGAGIPFHPGAEKFYKEKGLTAGEALTRTARDCFEAEAGVAHCRAFGAPQRGLQQSARVTKSTRQAASSRRSSTPRCASGRSAPPAPASSAAADRPVVLPLLHGRLRPAARDHAPRHPPRLRARPHLPGLSAAQVACSAPRRPALAATRRRAARRLAARARDRGVGALHPVHLRRPRVPRRQSRCRSTS